MNNEDEIEEMNYIASCSEFAKITSNEENSQKYFNSALDYGNVESSYKNKNWRVNEKSLTQCTIYTKGTIIR